LVKKIVLLILCLSAIDGFCQTPDSPANPTTLKFFFWSSQVDKPMWNFFNSVCHRFEEMNPGGRLIVDSYATEQYKAKLPLLMAINKPPDIFMSWGGAFLESYVRAGHVTPIDDVLFRIDPGGDLFPIMPLIP
jgi:raffinose/stachyose/melibiose transport system substrate-binding protein